MPPTTDATARTPATAHTPAPGEETRGVGRFGIRAVLGWGALVAGAVPLLLLWLLVEAQWPPLATLDARTAASLNDVVSRSSWAAATLRVITDLGGHEFAVLAFGLLTAFLAIRGRRRAAAFAAVTGLGLAILGPATKALVDRARPVVENPVVDVPSNASFPSGHAMTSLVTWGVLLMVTMPAVKRRVRPWLAAVAVLVVAGVGFSRLALGVHFVSDVLAGWALGLGWLAVTTLAFRAWQHDRGVHPHESYDPLELPGATPDGSAHGADGSQAVDRRAVGTLAGAAGLLWAVGTLAGVLVTSVLTGTWFGQVDRTVVREFVRLRTETLTDVATVVGMLSGTQAVIAVGLAAAVLAAAWTGSGRPVIFVVTAIVGELLLYVATSQAVGRLRPEVADLTSGLPGAASWPSGHAAAAAALYGAVAALVITCTRGRWRYAVLLLPVLLAPAIGLSRIYVAAHYPSDVVAGLLLGGAWVLVCARVLLPTFPPRGAAAR